MRRVRPWEDIHIRKSSTGTAAAAVPSRWPMRARPTKNIIAAVTRRTTAVPKFGWRMISPAIKPVIRSGGRNPSRKLSSRSCRRAK